MKKSTWLSLATAAAIVTTSAGTFAAWDTMDATTGALNLTLAEPVKTTIVGGGFNLESRELGQYPSYTQEVTLNIANLPDDITAYELQVDAKVYADGASIESASEVQGISAVVDKSDLTLGNMVDKKVKVTVTPTADLTEMNYDVVVTAKIAEKQIP